MTSHNPTKSNLWPYNFCSPFSRQRLDFQTRLQCSWYHTENRTWGIGHGGRVPDDVMWP